MTVNSGYSWRSFSLKDSLACVVCLTLDAATRRVTFSA